MSVIATLFSQLWGYLATLATWVLDGLFFVIGGILYFIFDGLLTFIVAAVNALDLSSLMFDAAATWGALPPQVLYCINALGIPQGLSLISYAVTIRMVLNIIPASWTRV